MTRRTERVAALAMGLMIVITLPPWAVIEPLAAAPLDQTPGPMADPPVWSDPLDDTSHVYVPEGGLVNVEVTGGAARLTAGATEGWIASSIITCPTGYRYDLVLLEVDMPGGSYVQLSVLNASKEASQIGYANETIVPYDKVKATDQSVYGVSPGYYPQLRIQVNLVASGTDKPRLLAWSLHYVALDEWRDDFLGTGKMTKLSGINVTAGVVELNLSRSGPSGGGSDDLPPVVVTSTSAGNAGTFAFYYADAARTTYEEKVDKACKGAYGVMFEDLNGDGNLDLICGDNQYQSASADSMIMWGDGSDTWSEADSTALKATGVWRLETGDFNGDGEIDIVFAMQTGSSSYVYLNKGGGTFNYDPDVTLTGGQWFWVGTGDVNNDGYDDIIMGEWNSQARCWWGGPSGPDNTVDAQYYGSGAGWYWDGFIKDVNYDGYMDLLTGSDGTQGNDLFLGGPSGLDTTVDYTFDTPSTMYECDAGDINGDGYGDVILAGGSNIYMVEGGASGWSFANKHLVSGISGEPRISVDDVNNDGFDDIVAVTATEFNVYLGGTEWPTTPAIAKAGTADDIDIAIARSKFGGGGYLRGRFVTEAISIPPEKKWDILHVDGTFPQNTSISITVLSDAGKAITGFKDIPGTDVDLSGILMERTIKVVVTIASEFNWTTPTLDLITVRWMDKGAWREQFYGAAKVERTQNLGVAGGVLAKAVSSGTGPQLLFTSILGDEGYTTQPTAFVDAGGLDYAGASPITFASAGTSAADTADVNGDGYVDVAFAVQRTGDSTYDTRSPLFLGTAVGFKAEPDREFTTTGASDLLLRDLNGDGRIDVVFAQETKDGTDHVINSTLFWGRADGSWNATPDLQLVTNGATGVVAADLDGDGRLDLVFSCFKDATSTATDSMVFLQGASGFCGTVPSHRLPTKGAWAVAVGDVDGDGRPDLVFANSFSMGTSEIDSYIYWGKAGGGFEATPAKLKTVGADDVKVADLDGDGDLDVVFANFKNNVPSYAVDSYIYLNPGSRAFPASPSVRLPTTGATAVAVADLDGTGRLDILLACSSNGSSFRQSSVVYLGGASGWPATPSFTLPTVGATDVLVAHLIRAGVGGYVSRTITPEDPAKTGTFHTFRYTAALGASQSGTVQLLDAVTWEVLAGTALHDGSNEWTVADLFWLKEHSSIRVAVTVSGLDRPGAFTLDDLWLNWTKRVMKAPVVEDLGLSSASLLRMRSGSLWLNITDEYDPIKQLFVVLEHRPSGTTGSWTSYLVSKPSFVNGTWRSTVYPKANAPVGSYDFRVSVTDSDLLSSGFIEFPNALVVLNNLPTAPVVRIAPASAVTTSTLQAVVVTPSSDVESGAVTYHYKWFRDGELQPALATDTVLSPLTTRGQNWTVEVRGFDGQDEGPVATFWVVIGNAGPMVRNALPNPEIKEDTTDSQWINLTSAFEDPDGDHMTWTVSNAPANITVTIDPATGRVTLAPAKDWYGEESVTFVASDGQAQASQSILITVTPVDDAPVFTTVNGEPIASDPITFTIKQGQLLVIVLGTADVEGNPLVFSVNTSAVQVNETTGEVRFQPGGDVIGTLRFAVTMSERDNPAMKVKLNFAITVENVNDPPGVPSITSPKAGAKYKVDATFSLVGLCTDPDMVFGQVLNFSWRANGTLLGYGTSRTVSFASPGTYNITLTVTDGEFTKTASMEVIIEAKEIPTPPPPPDIDEEQAAPPYALIVGAIVAICIVLIVVFMLVSRRRATELEAKDEAEEKRDAFKQMAVEVAATADQMEQELGEAKKKRKAEWVEDTGTEEVATGPAKPVEEVPVFEGPGIGDRLLSIKPRETEAASHDTMQLFKGTGAAGAAVSAEEQERRRVENLKRKYQTAIGRLPYGIPTDALKGKDWNELATALATGQKRTLADGREVTAIGGRWYYSDPGDSSTFLKEHGARPKEEAKKAAPAPAGAAEASAAPSLDRATLLAKLEERFIMGEISEKAYEALRKKYEDK